MSYFQYDKKNVYYTEVGEGTPLLLLHGNTASSNMFMEVVELYKQDFKVILIDFLGHGKSDRLSAFPMDLWYDEAQQVITLLKEKRYKKVSIIGTSGGAIVAINVGLEAPELVDNIIADSFEGEVALPEVTDFLKEDREMSKLREDSRMFYEWMHGDDWEGIVDQDTTAVIRHEQEIKKFFHKELNQLQADILFTGSLEDEFVSMLGTNYFQNCYHQMITKIGHGSMHLFQSGNHPAMLSNQKVFFDISKIFLESHGLSSRQFYV